MQPAAHYSAPAKAASKLRDDGFASESLPLAFRFTFRCFPILFF